MGKFEEMMNAAKNINDEKKEYEERISKIQQNLISSRMETTKYRETCNHQIKKIKALEHSKSMIQYQLKQTLQQLQNIKNGKKKKKEKGGIKEMTNLIQSSHQKEIEYVAEIE